MILFSGGPDQLEQNIWFRAGGSRPFADRVPEPHRMRDGVHGRFNETFVYRGMGARNLRALVVLFIDAAPLADREQIDFDWFFRKMRERLPAGTQLHGGFPGGPDEFLPTDFRMFLVRRFLEIVESPKYDSKRSVSYNSFIHVARFAFQQGDPYARKALETWTDKKWTGWKRVKEALEQCERMIPTDLATASSSDMLALLDDPDRRDHLLRLLSKPEVREDLSPEDRNRLARGLVRRMLAVETRESKQFVVVVVLRKLTGKDFGYEPFGTTNQRVEAVQKWVDWAGE